MKKDVNLYDFRNAFLNWDTYKNHYSLEGLNALYDYLADLEEDTGTELELDVIAIACDYTEYKDLKEFQNDYGKDYKTLEDIREKTQVIEIEDTDGFIIQAF